MKRLSIVILSMMLLVSSYVRVEAKKDSFLPQDSIAFSVYKNASQQNDRKNNNFSLEGEIFVENPFNWSDSQIENFYDIIRQGSSNKHFEELYINVNNKDYQTRVVRDESTNSIALFEVNNVLGNILVLLNGREYILYMDGMDMFIKDSKGNKIVVSKTYEIENTVNSRALNNTPYSSSDDYLFSSDIGPFNSQNLSLVAFIEFVSVAAGIVSGVHPVLGYIEFVATGLSLVMGESQYFTSYIKFWQANKLSDLTYMRQKERWFANSACTDQSFIKNYTRYFYTQKP